ncbi:hypothetical protein GQ53DRAFT_85690 [Thozetella sp. PMI_491]|nr:hypothetical protein GQ53DRAFT_85690 [Thozetella sp. PMI_491]
MWVTGTARSRKKEWLYQIISWILVYPSGADSSVSESRDRGALRCIRQRLYWRQPLLVASPVIVFCSNIRFAQWLL